MTTPEDRHARLVAEIKRRIRMVEGWTRESYGGNLAGEFMREVHRNERPMELSALLEIVERHRPHTEASDLCALCRDGFGECGEWPCADFLSAEKIMAMQSPSE
jgi:hypothetical protein